MNRYPVNNPINPFSLSRASISRRVLSPAFVQSLTTTHLAVSSVTDSRSMFLSSRSSPGIPSIILTNRPSPLNGRSRDDLLPAPGRHGAFFISLSSGTARPIDKRPDVAGLPDLARKRLKTARFQDARRLIKATGAELRGWSTAAQFIPLMYRSYRVNTLSDSLSAPISSGSPACDSSLVGGIGDGFHSTSLTKKAPARAFLKSICDCRSPCKQHGENDGFFFEQTVSVSAQRG